MNGDHTLKTKLLSLLVFFLVLAAITSGQPRTLAITGGTLVNTDGSGVMADSLILIQGNRITGVGLLEEMEVPKGAEVIRAAGKWIIPGLIDAHIHFFQSGGLYTRPDVIDLRGRFSYDEERALITPAGEGRVVVRGDMLITNLNDLLEIDLPHDTASTVGGLIMDQLGRVPKVGDTVQIEHIVLQVEAIAHNSVTSVRITLPAQDAEMIGEVQ